VQCIRLNSLIWYKLSEWPAVLHYVVWKSKIKISVWRQTRTIKFVFVYSTIWSVVLHFIQIYNPYSELAINIMLVFELDLCSNISTSPAISYLEGRRLNIRQRRYRVITYAYKYIWWMKYIYIFLHDINIGGVNIHLRWPVREPYTVQVCSDRR